MCREHSLKKVPEAVFIYWTSTLAHKLYTQISGYMSLGAVGWFGVKVVIMMSQS